MAQFLTTNGISLEIEKIIKEAKSGIVLICPYLQISQNLFERLKDADKRGLSILLIFGKKDLGITQKNQFLGLKNLKIKYFENLHAKCYMNEERCIVTSMNLHQYSEKNNREFGITITRSQEKGIFLDILDEVRSILRNSQEYGLQNESVIAKEPLAVSTSSVMLKVFDSLFGQKQGYCIRCATEIDHNTEKPLCDDCYQFWVVYKNFNYTEKFCHSCGKRNQTSFLKPECRKCYG